MRSLKESKESNTDLAVAVNELKARKRILEERVSHLALFDAGNSFM